MEAHKQACIDSDCGWEIMQLFMAFPGELVFYQICLLGYGQPSCPLNRNLLTSRDSLAFGLVSHLYQSKTLNYL